MDAPRGSLHTTHSRDLLPLGYSAVVVAVTLHQPLDAFLIRFPVGELWRFASPDWIEAGILMVQLPALAWFFRHPPPARSMCLLGITTALIVVSSILRGVESSAWRDLLLVITAVGSISGIAGRLGVQRSVIAVFLGLQPPLLWSILAAAAGWGWGFGGTVWQGAFWHRNSLAAAAAIGAVCGWHLVLVLPSRTRAATRLSIASLTGIDIAILLRTNNSSTMVGLVGGIGATIALLTVLRVATKAGLTHGLKRRIISTTYVTGVVISIGSFVVLSNVFSGLFGKPAGFSDRTRFWSESLQGIRAKPALGWGWRSAKTNPDFLALHEMFSGLDPHSTWFQITLSAGVAAAAALVLFVLIGLVRMGSAVVADPRASVVLVALPLLLLTILSAEDTAGAFAVPFALLVTLTTHCGSWDGAALQRQASQSGDLVP